MISFVIKYRKIYSFICFCIFASFLSVIYMVHDHNFLYPFRMFVVFLHESGHAIASILSGGLIEEFHMDHREGGHVLTRGGNTIALATSGYLGSLFFGIFFILASFELKNHSKYVLIIFSLWCFYISIFHYADQYTLIFGIVLGVLFFALSILNVFVINNILRFIGFFSIVFVPIDIFSDTISRHHLKSDAHIMSEVIGFSSSFWGYAWFILSIIISFIFIRSIITNHINNLIEKSSH